MAGRIYVTSDLHGYPLERFLALLKRGDFGADDFLFVLGDVIDRGEDGVRLLRWMADQPNVQMILGNHEAMMLACGFLFDEVTEKSLAELDGDKLNLVHNWMRNGAAPTLSALRELLRQEPEVLEGILDYLRDAPLYDTVEVNGTRYILVHGGLKNFRPDRPLSDYSPTELLWARPTPDTRYFVDATVIFGHTPTQYISEEYRGRAMSMPGWICIDTGAACGGAPMLLRLDDEKAFYE